MIEFLLIAAAATALPGLLTNSIKLKKRSEWSQPKNNASSATIEPSKQLMKHTGKLPGRGETLTTTNTSSGYDQVRDVHWTKTETLTIGND